MNRKLFTLLTVFITFVVYVLTAAPGLTFTDSGELAGVCTTLGIAHPTGYPLFTILGYLWTLLPLPFSDIYSLNLFAAFITSVSAGVFFNLVSIIIEYLYAYRIKKKIIKGKGKKAVREKAVIEKDETGIDQIMLIAVSFITALTFGFARTVWEQGTAIEVYCLHILIANLVLWALFKALISEDSSKTRYFGLSALFLGLGFTNHMTTVLLVPALLFIYFRRPGEKFNFSETRIKSFLYLLIPFAIGLSIYIFLPVRSATGPEFDWGGVSRGFDKFLYHVSGKQFQVWMFSGEQLDVNIARFFTLIPYQLAWVGLIPFVLGLANVYNSNRTVFWFLIILILTCVLYSINYSIHDIDTYFITAFTGILIFTGAGLYRLAQKVTKNRSSAISYGFIILPALAVIININENDRSDEYLVPEYTRILTENLEPDALIISAQWDYWCSAFWYKQRIEGYRPDIVLIEKELLRRTWFPDQLKRWYPEVMEKSRPELENYMFNLERFESGDRFDTMQIQTDFVRLLRSFVEKNIDNRPVYITADIMQNPGDSVFTAGYYKTPAGFAIRLTKSPLKLPVDINKLDIEKFVSSIKGRTEHLVNGIKETASFNLLILGRYMFLEKDAETAKKLFEMALQVNPENVTAKQMLDAIQ